MPKITTEIRNVAAKIGGPASSPPARRAWEKFKRNVQKLPLRVAHAMNLNCRVAPSNKGNRQAYLSKLSQDKVNPLDTFKGLIALSASEIPLSLEDLDEKQIYRLFENFKSHGEIIPVLDKQITDMTASGGLNDHEYNLLEFFQRLKVNQEAAATTLMKSAGYEKEHLNVHVNRTREARLEKLLGDVWKRAKDGDDGDPATLLRTEISKAKDNYRIKNGTAEQRKFGKALKEVQKTFASEGRIAQESLKTLLEHARRITNSKSLEENPANLFKKLSYRDADNYSPTVERSTAEQWNLLNPFLEAMSDQIDGVDTARQDLKYAIDNIKKSKNRREELRAPDLTEITHRHDVMAAIHDLARYVRSTLPDDPRLTAPDKFKAGVNEVLTKQKFTVETVENMQIFLKHADQMTLTRHSKVVRDAMREFYELSPLGAAAAEPSETIGAVAEQVVAVNPTAQSIGETDGLIFEGLLEHFTNFVNKLIDDEPRDIDNEVRRRIAHAPRSEILQIRDFFIRHAWMPAYFNKGETNVEKLFGAIAQNYSYYANQAVLKGAISEPEFWIERQEKKIDRFEKLLTRYGHEKNGYPDPSYGLQTYVDTLNTNLVELPEAFSPFYKYFADEENRVMDDLLIVKSETDYLEVLADFADIARSLAVDASPQGIQARSGQGFDIDSQPKRHQADREQISGICLPSSNGACGQGSALLEYRLGAVDEANARSTRSKSLRNSSVNMRASIPIQDWFVAYPKGIAITSCSITSSPMKRRLVK